MSYEIVKCLKIDTEDNKVWVKSDSNNIYPKRFEWFESKSLSTILKDLGKKEVEKVILVEYWGGGFQKSNNIYDKVVKFYKSRLPYTWENVGAYTEIGKRKWSNGEIIKYSYENLAESLYECLLKFRNRDMSKTWVIRRNSGDFVCGKTKTIIKTIKYADKAKKFKSFEDAIIYDCGDDVIDYDSL